MKKQTKTLVLSKETVRNLADVNLKAAEGAKPPIVSIEVCETSEAHC